MLARAGYCPVILERGEDVDSRRKRVDEFWKTGKLDVRSNVQFGEGGAGTFSDGKLNTLVKDPLMRNRLVLEVFCEFGADSSILYDSKPHIGTDVLSGIVKAMRQEVVRLGGHVRFGCQVTELVTEGGADQRGKGASAGREGRMITWLEMKIRSGEEFLSAPGCDSGNWSQRTGYLFYAGTEKNTHGCQVLCRRTAGFSTPSL